MKILVVAFLPDSSLKIVLDPLLLLPNVEKVLLLRKIPYPNHSPKIEQIDYPIFRCIPFPEIRRVLNGLSALRQRPDMVLSIHIHPHGYIGWVLSRIAGIPFALNVIASAWEFTRHGRFFAWLNRLMFRTKVYYAVTGEKTRRFLHIHRVPDNRIFIVPNVVDITRFQPVECEKTHDVAFVARLDENKNGYVLFRAIAHLKDEGLRVTVRVAGTGVSEQKYRANVEQLGIADQITFCGRIGHDKIPSLLATSRVFAITSISEGFPLALLEAMSSGIPAVCSTAGDIPDIIDHRENGMIFQNPEDDRTLANHLRDLLTDDALYTKVRENGLRIRQTHSFEMSAQRWSKMINAMLGSKAHQ
jgi:glycosyltransferase involved in cell wall biosynthesis